MKRCKVSNEEGFTLAEVLVTILMMSLVVMALYSMFDMSLRVFSLGNSTVETNENARVALDRMEREIRSAWHSDSDCSSETVPELPLATTSNRTQITFWNCLSGDDAPPVKITYSMGGGNGNVLQRIENGTARPLANLSTIEPLKFRYLDKNGTNHLPPNSEVVLVEIRLVASDGDQEQTLITNAGLRNAN